MSRLENNTTQSTPRSQPSPPHQTPAEALDTTGLPGGCPSLVRSPGETGRGSCSGLNRLLRGRLLRDVLHRVSRTGQDLVRPGRRSRTERRKRGKTEIEKEKEKVLGA